ncbi:MAG: glycosyl hydrolase, partial [Verrucomicrobiales bacterium]
QWPRLERFRLPLLGPCPANYKGAWRTAYETIAEEQGLRADYMAMHWYSISGASSGSPSTLINNMQTLYDLYGKPIWLTEFSTRDFVGDKTTWSRNHNYNFLAEFIWRAESLPWLKQYSVFEWAMYGGDPDTTDAASDDPAAMNSPRLALHYQNDSTDPGWEDLAECGLLLAGWDGNDRVLDDTAYIIHNKGRFLRLIDDPESDTVTTANVLHRAETEQFMLQTAPNGNKYLIGLSDGRRLSCDGSSVSLAAANTTGTAVEWTLNEYQYGWFYLDHPATGKRLNITSAGVVNVASSTSANDNVRFRFIKHYLPITLTEKQTLPYRESFENGRGAWRQFTEQDKYWETGTGGTPTAAAGPSGASDGDFYLFSEGHDAGSNVSSTVECSFDFSSVPSVEMSFDYHMYGNYISFLSLDVHDGESWTTDVWKMEGAQHNNSDAPWTNTTIDLSRYAGNPNVKLRFRTQNTQWNAADPAIDNIQLVVASTSPTFESWAESAFLNTPDGIDQSESGDPDADSFSNLEEWLFGTNPLVSDSPIKNIATEGAQMSVEFTRRKLDDFEIRAEWSPDLTDLSWETSGLTELVLSDDGEIETVEVRIAMDRDEKFIRIRASE